MDEDKKYENRTEVRRHLLLYLDVRDLESGQSIGRLGDINEKGILLLTDKPLKAGNTLQLGIRIPRTIDPGRAMLEVCAQVRWCRPDIRPDMFAAGCSITSIDDESRSFIETLIDRIGFSDGTRKIFLKNDQNVFLDTDESR